MKMSDKDHPMPLTLCPNCGHKLRRASGINTEGPPTPGDITICIKCGKILEFQPDMTTATISIRDLPPTTQQIIRQGQAAIRHASTQKHGPSRMD